MPIDITPVVEFGLPPSDPRPTIPHDVYLAWLSAPADDASDGLARVALDLLSERNAYREALTDALNRWSDDTRPVRES